MDKIYRIIWADDEIDALLDENGRALISKQHVEVIKCNNAAMLEEKLKNVNHRIDAVISMLILQRGILLHLMKQLFLA